MNEVARHYDLLLDEGNDPVLDPPELAAYMDGWDGGGFIGELLLDGTQDVLEIGVGTGRLALRIITACRSFTGIDISQRSIARAGEHMAGHSHVQLICDDFMTCRLQGPYDVICSSLTFMHLADKQAAADKIASLLRPGGRAVISLDKDMSGVIDYGTRRLTVYPDDPARLAEHLSAAGLTVMSAKETVFAVILTAIKEEY